MGTDTAFGMIFYQTGPCTVFTKKFRHLVRDRRFVIGSLTAELMAVGSGEALEPFIWTHIKGQ